MRRYISSYDLKYAPREEYDVIILGSGIAGLYSSLHIDPSLRCAVVTKDDARHSNSYFAQGGIAAVMSKEDSYTLHVDDTLEAGAGLCERSAVEVLVSEGPENIRELVEMDVPFDVNAEGELLITREGGHSQRRIVHCGGDATGRETTRRLAHIAMAKENIKFLLNTYFIDLLSDERGVFGLVVFDTQPKVLLCRNIIMATGGIGQVYARTTNPKGAVGDGIAATLRAGGQVENMELVQFHPTTLATHYETDRLFLISEAVRGEGGILKNRAGEAFMQGVHPRADLAPRDIVTRAIYAELRKTGDTNVFLDVSDMSEEFFAARFPTIYAECKKFGINVPQDMIPVVPAQHYLMGGIKTDLNAMTNIEGLYACGEAAWTGIHGANRLASNSMLECLVFGRRAAQYINASLRPLGVYELPYGFSPSGGAINTFQIGGLYQEIKTIMTQYVGVVRTKSGMEFAKERVEKISEFLETKILSTPEGYELYNAAEIALEIIKGALARKDSVGAHYVVPDNSPEKLV
ncbi:MAG: L-aspartate oxidase [Eubacteriales bacterium]